MKFFRYRKPSLNNVLGITRAKRRAKKALGINAVMAPFRAPGNFVRGVKRKSGYYAVNRALKGQIPTPLGIGSSSGGAGLVGCLPLLFIVWLIGSIGSCGKTPVATRAAEPAMQPAVEMKNGKPLTPEQIRERDAYIARAIAKKRQREQDALRRSQAQVYAAQIAAQEFQRRQDAKNSQIQPSRPSNAFAAPPETTFESSPRIWEQPPQVVSGWDASVPVGRGATPTVETYHRGQVVAEDPNTYVPPAAYQNLPPGTTGTRVFTPGYGSGSSYGAQSGTGRYVSGYRSRSGLSLPSGGYHGVGPEPDGRPKTVSVRGYFRKDGTYVRPHMRRAPRRR